MCSSLGRLPPENVEEFVMQAFEKPGQRRAYKDRTAERWHVAIIRAAPLCASSAATGQCILGAPTE